MGAYRFHSNDWRFGTGFEWLPKHATDWGGSSNLLIWHVGDLDYRLGDNWALNAQAGFARFYRDFPSYGIGFGLGLKYRLSDDWVLSATANRYDVDVSNGVPATERLKDHFTFASFTLQRRF